MLRIASLALLLAAAFAADAQAGGCCCPSCGCHNVKKVCKPVCEMKKETKFVYDCVCEDFCVPGPSKIVGCHCKTDCNGCEHCCPARQPTCAAVRARTKLVKTAVEIEKPSIKWVVQTVCCGCGAVCGNGSCAQGCAEGACTSGAAAPAAAAQAPTFAEPPLPPAPTPVHEASFQPQPNALLQAFSEPQQ
jgi:hypothetical protein